MQQRPLNNEEKLDIMYRLIVKQEKSRVFTQRMKIFKWLIILWIFITVLSNPEAMIWKFTNYLQPMVMKSMSGVIENQKVKNAQDIQKMLQDIQAIPY
jgi:hypothetical protein